MKQEILIQKCSKHDLETIAFDMNPRADPSCRNCCIYCFQDPLKAQYCLSLGEARIHLLNVKKTFKQRKETQLKNNISILKELDKNISELKNIYVQTFDQIKESINHQIQQYQEYNSTLEQKLQSIDLDQYLSNTHDFATESLTNLGFKEKCQNLLESIFSQSSKDQFGSKLNELDDSSILFQSERNIEKNSQIKKKALLSFKCQKHGEEIQWCNEGQSKLCEDRLLCDECSIDQKGPFKTILSIFKDWEQYKITQIQYIQEKQQQFSLKLRNAIKHYKDYQKELNNVINEIINTLEKEDQEQQNIYRSKISKLEQNWNTLNKEQLIKIINTVNQPLLRDNKIIKRQQKLEQKRDQLNSLLNNQLTLLIQIIKKNLQIIMKSINYDYNLLKVIQQEESNVIEQESQTTQETNSIQCLTVNLRFSNIQYINEFIMKLLNIEKQLKQQQCNEAFIKDQFNNIYSLFKLIKQDEVQFKEFCNKIFLQIKQEFKKHEIEIANEEENKYIYINELLKDPQVCENNLQSQLTIIKEVQTQMFSCINDNFKDYTYYQNFINSIEDRINSSSKKQIIQYNNFFQWKVTIKWITSEDFMTYLEKDMLSELEAYCKGDYQNKLEDFLNWFTSLGFEIVKANVSVLKDTLPQWFLIYEKKQRLLCSCFKQVQSSGIFSHQSSIQSNCPKFFKSLKQNEEIIQLMEQNQLTNLIKQYKNQDKIIFNHTTEVATIKNIDEVLLYQKSIDCKLKFRQVKEPIYKTLEYVRTRSEDNRMIFEKCISDLILGALCQNDYQGWKQIFIEIDEIILDELKDSKQFSTIQNEQNANITRYRRRQIQIIISKIKQKIKDFNLHFSNFGINLNDFGESILLKLLLQNAIFVIWRFFCFEKMSKEKQIEKQQFLVHYSRFQAELQDNQIEKSRYFGYFLGENIQLQTITKLYEKQQMFHNQVIGDFIQEQSSFELIKKLDNQILPNIIFGKAEYCIYDTIKQNFLQQYFQGKIKMQLMSRYQNI